MKQIGIPIQKYTCENKTEPIHNPQGSQKYSAEQKKNKRVHIVWLHLDEAFKKNTSHLQWWKRDQWLPGGTGTGLGSKEIFWGNRNVYIDFWNSPNCILKIGTFYFIHITPPC